MVTIKQTTRHTWRHRKRCNGLLSACIGLLLLIFAQAPVTAQDLLNTGTVRNTGVMRVKRAAKSLDTLGGRFEYFGGNQTLWAKQYYDVILSGIGTDTVPAGNPFVTVIDSLVVQQNITLSIDTSSSILLKGYLSEQGYLSGKIQKSDNLTGGTTFSNFGNVGATISWTGTAPGSTTVTRTSGIALTGNGHQSIKRYYDITSMQTSGLDATLVFQYNPIELNGQNASKLVLWKSIDNGTTWKNQAGVLDTSMHTITKTNINTFGTVSSRWAVTDSANALGTFRNAVASVLAVSSVTETSTVLTKVQPFVIRVKDVFGNPIEGEPVLFALDTASVPVGAYGYGPILLATTTDTNGIASDTLTLGSKVGVYTLRAFVDTFPPVVFTSKATTGAAKSIVAFSGNNQSKAALKYLDQPFVVTVIDTGGNPVQGIRVDFAISGKPAFARRESLSVSTVFSDSLGYATTLLKVGNRPGTYTVTATSPGLTAQMFTATGTLLLADANDDSKVNIADLTTMIDGVIGNVSLSESDSIRADIDSNGTVDTKDISKILDGLLHGVWDTMSFSSMFKLTAQQSVQSLSAEFEVTPNGLRFNLTNDVPIKGVQILLRLKNPSALNKPDVIFNRANVMQVPLNDSAGIIHIVVYNNTNSPIDTGNGSLFRLPLLFADTSEFDIAGVIVSMPNDQGVLIPAVKTVASGKYPATYGLVQNYPNPFNNETSVRFVVPDVAGKFASVLVQVFSMNGQRVATIVNGDYQAGTYTIKWNGTNDQGLPVASGVYLLRLWSSEHFYIKKMILMK